MALLLISSFSQITEASFALHLLRASFLKNIHFLLCKILNSNFVKIRAIFSVVQGRCGGDIIYEELGSQLQNKHIVLWGQICCWCYFYSMGWSHGIMGRRFPDGRLLRYRKWVPQQLGDVNKQESGDSQPMGARHSDTAANHNSTHFLVWSTGPLLIFFGRPDWKLFLSFLPILLWH